MIDSDNPDALVCGRCFEEVDVLYPANCSEKPEAVTGPIGMYHCPDCGTMLLAGHPHPYLCTRCLSRHHPMYDKGCDER